MPCGKPDCICAFLDLAIPAPADMPCARCGSPHAGNVNQPLTRPMLFTGEVATHYMTCPSTMEPTLWMNALGACPALDAHAETALTRPPVVS